VNAAFDPMVQEVLTKINEDYVGLYEIVWNFRSNFLPDASEDEIVAAAQEAVKEVLAKGYARLVWYRVEPPSTPRAMTAEEVERVLASPTSWQPPASWGDEFPNLDATPEGERAWLRPEADR
jgi:hypothetical protein